MAKRYLQQANMDKAVVLAKQAFIASERAFFDPSLLALLYFPDDQKSKDDQKARIRFRVSRVEPV